MEAVDPDHPEALPQLYAAWRRRTLVGVVIATIIGLAAHGPTGEFRFDLEGERASPWLLLGLAAVAIGAFGPGLAGTGFGLAAIRSWRRLRTSSRWARAAWIVWVLGPLPLLLLPVSQLFGLNPQDALKTSTTQVRQLLAVTAPALFSLLPGTLRSALVLKRFVPESRAPGQITLLAAPVCTVAYLLPLAVLTQLAFHAGLYLGMLLLALPPLVPLLAARWLLGRDRTDRAARRVRAVVAVQGVLAASGVAMLAAWVGDHPPLRALLGRVDAVWVVGLAAKMLASKWLTAVVVTDMLLSMLYQGREAARSLAGSAEGESLARRLDALGQALRPDQGPKG